ncbi:hypothetical protein DACRYDRAFT_112829 [Dacryopinax primogenitus]|uniref:Uncharacterized protein n=1 Tax=Dacryopinax primogenitus (strain DJM 731) TaxID=1858805 RepID=M5GAW4_DACPD|nr:uncharacterized protein DACRYDRAFT_112829 [Dacryopinax primogenitus]EJU06039.1 hypothetical protein DACRYDRAFT_112829 [Dacryopinax primogenitus]
MPEVLRRRNDSPPQPLSSTGDCSPSTDENSSRAPSSRPRSQLFNFDKAMAWLSRTPATPTRPTSPTQSTTSGGRSPRSPPSKPPRSSLSTPPASPKAKAPPLPTQPAARPSRDELRKTTVRSKESEQALMDPEAYTINRAKLVNLRPVIDTSPPSTIRRAGGPPTAQSRPSVKPLTPCRSSLKRSTNDVPPSPSFPPSSIVPFNRLVLEPSALPPFEPQLLAGPPQSGTYSRNSLVTLETSSMTMRTTIDTLTSRPSLLAHYILELCPNPPSGPPKVPTETLHIFLDRPSSPYNIILSYLRLPRSRDNSLPALPRAVQLPSHSQTTSMVGVSKLEALLDLRDEARWLGLEELEAMCEEELRTAGLVKPTKHATIAEETESDLPPTTASSVASAAPSLSSHEGEISPIIPPERSIPTPPTSSDSDLTPPARTRSPPTTPSANAGRATTVARARPVPRRQPSNSYQGSRPLPAIPTSQASSERRSSEPATNGLPTAKAQTLAPDSKTAPSLTEDEKAHRAREKLSEALSLRRRNAGSIIHSPIIGLAALAPEPRSSIASEGSLSPGRYL